MKIYTNYFKIFVSWDIVIKNNANKGLKLVKKEHFDMIPYMKIKNR